MTERTLNPVLFDRLVSIHDYLKPVLQQEAVYGGAPVLQATEELTFYASPSGSDANDGLTPATAVRNPQTVIDKLPKITGYLSTINMAPGEYEKGILLEGFDCYKNGGVKIVGADELATGLTGANTGTAEATSNTYQIKDAAAGWAVNELVNKWIEVDGETVPIHSNTADTINCASYFSTSPATKTYQIKQNAVTIKGAVPFAASTTGGLIVTNCRAARSNWFSVEKVNFDAATPGALVGALVYSSSNFEAKQLVFDGGFYGFATQNCSNVRTSGMICKNSVLYGWVSIRDHDVYGGLSGLSCNNNNDVGIGIIGGSPVVNFETISSFDNGGDGVWIGQSPWVDIDSGYFNGNGGAPVRVGDRTGNANMSCVASLTSSRYDMDGCGEPLQVSEGSYIKIANASGTIAADFGIEVDLGGRVFVDTPSMSLTGAVGDMTLDGHGAVNYADLAVDGAFVDNPATGSIIARRDNIQPPTAPPKVTAKTSLEIHKSTKIYVDAAGDDTNDGLDAARPKATIAAAIASVPKIIAPDVTVEIEVGAGEFEGARIDAFDVRDRAQLWIHGTFIDATLATGTTSGTATGGDTDTVTDSGQAWTVNDLVGKLVVVDGERRWIRSNTATGIEIVGVFSASANGKAYSIVEPGTRLTTFPASGHSFAYFEGSGNKVASSSIGTFKDTQGILLEGFYCDGQGGSYDAVWFDNTDPIHLKAIQADTPFFGIAMQHVGKRMRISECWVNDMAGPASYASFFLFYCPEFLVSNSIAINSGGAGLKVVASTLQTYDCVFDNCAGVAGIQLDSCQIAILNDTISVNNNQNGVYSLNSYCQVARGDYSDNGEYGVQLVQSRGYMIGAVTGTGNAEYGIYADKGSNIQIPSTATLTGTTGDVLVDVTAATYAGDFTALDSSVFDSTTGCWVQRYN